MPHKGTYAGRGGQAVPKGSKLAGDIIALSDEAKLEKQVATKQKAMRDKGKSPSAAKKKAIKKQSPKHKSAVNKLKAAELFEKARAVEASGTGNKRAAKTYRQAARELLARIPKGK